MIFKSAILITRRGSEAEAGTKKGVGVQDQGPPLTSDTAGESLLAGTTTEAAGETDPEAPEGGTIETIETIKKTIGINPRKNLQVKNNF